MVERGHVLERMTLLRSGALELEGLYQSGGVRGQGMPVVFAPSHPRYGGTMESAVLGELVWCLARLGHPTLRFNWRGVGASMGVTRVPWPPAPLLRLDDELADLGAAVEQHAPDHPCAVVGVGLGACVAAELAKTHPRIERVALIAPIVAAWQVQPQLLVESGVRVGAWVGTEDTVAGANAVRAALEPHVRVQLVEKAGHTFSRGLSELGHSVAEFIAGQTRPHDG